MAIIQVVIHKIALGTNNSDLIVGTAGDDVIYANGGIDVVFGLDGNDIISGGLATDFLYGGSGNDALLGGDGADYLYGEGGADVLYGEAGNDYLNGGSGSDVILGGAGNDLIDGDADVDTVVFAGKSSEYIVRFNPDHSVTVIDSRASRDGVDIIYNAEFLKFSNTTIALPSANTPPVTNNVTGNGLEDASIIPITLSGTDNGSIASFALSSLPANGSLYTDAAHTNIVAINTYYAATNNQLTLYFVPNADFNGDVSFSYSAKDNTGLVDTTPALATIHITPVNDAPTLANAIPDRTTNEDAAFSFTLPANTFADKDVGDHFSYIAKLADGSNLPTWLHFDAATRTFSGTPLNENVGTVAVKVTATDSGGLSISDTFNLTVNNVNDAPVLANAVSDQIATEDAAFSFTLPAGTFTDVDAGDQLSYIAKLAGGSDLPAWLHFDAATRTFSGTPLNENVGTVAVKVTATDLGGLSASDTFNLTVNNVNDAPVLANAVSDQIATEDAAFSFTLPSGTFTDVDAGDQLSYIAKQADGSDLPTWLHFDAATRTFSGTPLNEDVDTVAVKVTATDSGGLSASDTFNLTVNNVNDAPVLANAVSDQIATEDAAFSFTLPSGTFTDVDAEDHLTYSATLSDGSPLPSWLMLSGKTLSGTPTNDDVGTLSIKVTASDQDHAEASDIFNLTVNNVNDAPTVANPIPDKITDEDSLFAFRFHDTVFSDEDVGDVLTYTATLSDGSDLPAWLTFDAANTRFSGTPDDADVGTISIKLTAHDSAGAMVSDEFNLTVNPVNDAPVFNEAIPNQTINEDSPLNFQFDKNTFKDEDHDSLTYIVKLDNGDPLPAWLHFNSINRTFTGTPDDPDLALSPLNIKVTAMDPSGEFASTNFSLTINSVNDAPVLANAISDQIAVRNTPFELSLNGVFSDQDAEDVLTYTATLANGSSLPNWLELTSDERGNASLSGTPSDLALYSIKITATDREGVQATDIFYLQVSKGESDLFGEGADTVNFNEILAASYTNGTQYNALGGDDIVTLPYDMSTATRAGYDPLVTFDGGAGNNQITTGTVADLVAGGSDNDTFYVGALNASGLDNYNGNAGSDTLNLSLLNPSIGTATALSSIGGEAPYLYVDDVKQADLQSIENVIGSSGDDQMYSSNAVNTLMGGQGDDIFYLAAVNTSGTDTYDGEGGTNTVDLSFLSPSPTQVSINLITGGFGSHRVVVDGFVEATLFNIQNVQGSSGADTITLNDQVNSVAGHGGDDTFIMKQLNVSGVDHYSGGAGFNTLDLSPLVSISGADITLGMGSDQDSVTINGQLQATFKTIQQVLGTVYNDHFTSNESVNTFNGGAGDDKYTVGALNSSGVDTYNEFGGIDTLDLSMLTPSIGTDTALTSIGGDTPYLLVDNVRQANLQDIENIIGSSGDDHMYSSNAVNTLMGGLGDDTFYLAALNISGVDAYNGEGGTNTLDLSFLSLSPTQTVLVNLLTSGYDSSKVIVEGVVQATLTNIQNVNGSSGADIFTLNDQVNSVFGSSGDDTFIMKQLNISGVDHYSGGAGFNTVDLGGLNSVSGADIFFGPGGSVQDTVTINGQLQASLKNIQQVLGTDYNDHFTSNDSVNTFNGGASNDTYTVGALNSSGVDTYNEFGGVDTLDLSLINSSFVTQTALLSINGDTPYLYVDDGVDNIRQANLQDIENIIGSSGIDRMYSSDAINSLMGGLGDDTFYLAALNISGFDTYDGGAGNDTVDLSMLNPTTAVVDLLNNQAVVVDGVFQAFINSIENVTGSSGNDIILTDTKANIINAKTGDDTIYMDALNASGVDSYNGGGGNDTLDLSQLFFVTNVQINLLGNPLDPVSQASYVSINGQLQAYFSKFPTVIGTNYNDHFTSNATLNNFVGNEGDDIFTVGTVNTNTAIDSYIGGAGVNTLDLSLLDPSFFVTVYLDGDVSPQLIVNSGAGDIQQATLQDIANVIGSPGADKIHAYDQVNYLQGGAGNDTFIMAAVNSISALDHYDGGAGINALDLSKLNPTSSVVDLNAHTVTVDGVAQATLDFIQNVTGTSGSDTIISDNQINIINAKTGNDTIYMGALNTSGVDTYSGGGGSDTLDLSQLTSIGNAQINLMGNPSDPVSDAAYVIIDGQLQAYFSKIQTVIGTNYNDHFTSDLALNHFIGNAGDDVFVLGALNNSSTAVDTYIGGTGNNILDLSFLGSSVQTDIILYGPSPYVSVDGVMQATFSDITTVVGGPGVNHFFTGDQADTLLGGNGNDTFTIMQLNLSGLDFLAGGLGENTLDLSQLSAGSSAEVDLTSRTLRVDGIGEAQFADIANVIGSSGDDLIAGNEFNNIIKSLGDTGHGDFIDGGDGVDTSVMTGVHDNYTYIGDAGGGITVMDHVGSDGTDFLVNMELIQFTDRTIDLKSLIYDQQEHPF